MGEALEARGGWVLNPWVRTLPSILGVCKPALEGSAGQAAACASPAPQISPDPTQTRAPPSWLLRPARLPCDSGGQGGFLQANPRPASCLPARGLHHCQLQTRRRRRDVWRPFLAGSQPRGQQMSLLPAARGRQPPPPSLSAASRPGCPAPRGSSAPTSPPRWTQGMTQGGSPPPPAGLPQERGR